MGHLTQRAWKILPFTVADKVIRIEPGGITVDYDDVDRKEARAIAKLVAAAPKMYRRINTMCAALREVRKWMDEPTLRDEAARIERENNLRSMLDKAIGMNSNASQKSVSRDHARLSRARKN